MNAEPVIVLVHSPLLGPFAWESLANSLGNISRQTLCPDLTPCLTKTPPYWDCMVDAVRRSSRDRPVVLVGHSGAGPLLPALSPAFGLIEGYVFVDAGLPHPGRSFLGNLPVELAATLRAREDAGWLPPWSEWWPPAVLADLLPDDRQRLAFSERCPRLPFALFEEPMPAAPWWPDAPCGYLRLSPAYADLADEARGLGWPVRELASHHLGMLTDPQTVARELMALASELDAARV